MHQSLSRRFLTLSIGLFLAIGLSLASSPVQAEPAALGQITGQVTDARTHGGLDRIRVEVFTSNWQYLRATTANKRGVYWFGELPLGAYHVKFIDTRPRYDVTAHLDTDRPVSVKQADSATVLNVKLQRGASITGTVKAGKSRAKNAKLIAVNQYGGSYEVKANSQGQFALGGLSAANYSVFAYDANKQYTGRSVYVKNLRSGTSKNIYISMKTRAGAFAGLLTAGGRRLTSTVYVTAVNKSTGQYWVQKVAKGDLSSLRGLAPGKYSLSVPGADGYLGRTIANIGTIKSKRTTDAFANLNVRGARVVGTVVDANGQKPLAGVSVSLYDRYGTQVGRGKTTSTGSFSIGGSTPTSTGLTLVVESESPINGQSYGKVELKGLSLRTGTNTDVGTITLVGGGHVIGKVIDAATSMPLAGVSVSLYDRSGTKVARGKTTATGTFNIGGTTRTSTGLTLVVETESPINGQTYGTVRIPGLPLTNGTNTDVGTISLAGAGHVVGTVVDVSTGAPLAGVAVTLYDGKDNWLAQGTTDATGKFNLGGTIPSSTELTLVVQAYSPINGKAYGIKRISGLSLTNGANTDVGTVTLVGGGHVIGGVVDAGTLMPLAGVTATLYDRNGNWLAQGTTNANGTFDIGGTALTATDLTLVVKAYSPINGQTYATRYISGLSLTNGMNTEVGSITLTGH